MKRFLLLVAIIGSCLALSGNAFADWAFQISNDNMDETWEVYLLTDETLNINGYSLSFTFDYEPSHLDWNVANYSNTPPVGMFAVGAPNKDGSDAIINFDAMSPPPNPVAVTSDTQIGSFTLDYNGGRVPNVDDFGWNADQPDFYARINGTIYTGTQLEANHLTVATPVPLPGAGLLLLLGGTSLMGITGLKKIKK
jgi:hypothetical protein